MKCLKCVFVSVWIILCTCLVIVMSVCSLGTTVGQILDIVLTYHILINLLLVSHLLLVEKNTCKTNTLNSSKSLNNSLTNVFFACFVLIDKCLNLNVDVLLLKWMIALLYPSRDHELHLAQTSTWSEFSWILWLAEWSSDVLRHPDIQQ